MMQKKQSSFSIEIFLLLVEGALRSIPFNAAIALLLGLDFLYNKVPASLIALWLLAIISLVFIRWICCHLLIKSEYFRLKYRSSFTIFYVLTFLMGITWGGSYFIFLPYFNNTNEAVFIVVLGGLAAGALVSMSMCLPAYYAYVIPMFLPIIIYNFYLAEFDKIILAIMYLLFVLMVFLTAKVNARLLSVTSKLNKEKDTLINQLMESNLKLEQSIKEARTLSITDALTGLFNRRYFDMVLSKELNRAKRGNYTVNLVFMDIDNFKYINDNFGHPCGDEFLIYVADALKSSIRRAGDFIFRLGGDEFAAILPMPAEEVVCFCSMVQERFNGQSKYKNVTLSMGIVSMLSSQISDYEFIIHAADHVLYQAKKSGKNTIATKVLK